MRAPELRTAGMSATLRSKRFPITQPTLIRLLTESDLVWGVGFAMADATLKAVQGQSKHPVAIIDNGSDSQVS